MKFQLYRFAFLLYFLIFSQLQVSGFHLIGGELTYNCLGNGDYEFFAKLYRDCNCTGCAQLDPALTVSIFQCGNSINCRALDQGDELHSIYPPLLKVRLVEPPDYPCYIPPDVCVQSGFYQWKLSDFGISLEQSADSYIISFQRCCRNSTVTNLQSPDSQGATYSVEITPESQASCNSSAVFNNFPPTVICAGAPLNIDHSATDSDGDVLVYELCSPLQGGGNAPDGTLPGGCRSPQPDPACPPPYYQVSYGISGYSEFTPLDADPQLQINSSTGLITGTPTTQGQYVVGICVSEYRDGVLINKGFRDFQFNVTKCDPTVEILIDSDEFDFNPKSFTINSCGDNTILFQNQSFQQIYIDDYRWEFDIGGTTQIFNEWEPLIEFPDKGTYTGNLFLNPGSECADTASIIINVFPDLTADFDFEYDTCKKSPVAFFDNSFSEQGEIYQWFWRFGDGTTDTVQNPSYTYEEFGAYDVLLAVRDTNNCQTALTQTINYFPLPEEIIIAPSAEEGCEPVEVFFNNLTASINESYEIDWDFGDGSNSTELSPTHVFETPGEYSVIIEIVSPAGCRKDTVFPNLVLVKEQSIADFIYSPEELSSENPTASFQDQSLKAARVEWTFDRLFRTLEPNPSYTFRDTGSHEIRLIATSASGCTDTAYARIDLIPEIKFYLPNAFTPNYDNFNDTYIGVGVFEFAQNYQMSIWNRWGELVFQSSNPTEGWNGKKNNTGKPSPPGVYMVQVSFEDPRGKNFEFLGNATLIR